MADLTIQERAMRERARRERQRRYEEGMSNLDIPSDVRSMRPDEQLPSTTRVEAGFNRPTYPTIGQAQEEELDPAVRQPEDIGEGLQAFTAGWASGKTIGGTEMYEEDFPRAARYKGSLPYTAGDLIGMTGPINWVVDKFGRLVKMVKPLTKIGKTLSEVEKLRAVQNPTAAQSIRRLALEKAAENAPAGQQLAHGAENLIRQGLEVGTAGGTLNAARQGAEMALGKREDFSFGELGQEAAMWGALGAAIKLPPLISKPVETLLKQKKYEAAERLYRHFTKDSPQFRSPEVDAFFQKVKAPRPLALPAPPQRQMIGVGPGYGEGFTHRNVAPADEAALRNAEGQNAAAEQARFQQELRASGTSNMLPMPRGYATGEGFIMSPIARDYPPGTGRVRPPEIGPRPSIDELAAERRQSILLRVRQRAQQEKMRRLSGNRPMQPGDVDEFAQGGGMTLNPVPEAGLKNQPDPLMTQPEIQKPLTAEVPQVTPPVTKGGGGPQTYRVYHGTRADFDNFDMKQAGQSDPGLVGRGVYFAANKDQAMSFANNPYYGPKAKGTPRVVEADVTLSNPAIIQDGKLPDGRTLTDIHPNGINKDAARRINGELRKSGYDGVVFKIGDDVTQVVAFDTKAIKPPSSAKTPVAKEPWMMTRDEWHVEKEKLRPNAQGTGGGGYKTNIGNRGGGSGARNAGTYMQERTLFLNDNIKKIDPETGMAEHINHRDVISKAISEGKPVPPEVLADYPDLAKKYGKAKEGGTSTPIKPEETKLYSIGGAAYGIEPEKDKDGNTVGYRFNPVKALAGMALAIGAVEGFSRLSRGQQIRELRKIGESSGLTAAEIRAAESDLKIGKSLTPAVANKLEAGFKQVKNSAKTDFAETQAAQTTAKVTETQRVVLDKAFPKVVDLKPQTYAQALEFVKASEAKINAARKEMYNAIGRDPRYKTVKKDGTVSYGTAINPKYDRTEWLEWFKKREEYRKRVIEPLKDELARVQEAADRLPRSLTTTIGGGRAYLADFRRNVNRVLGDKDASVLLTSKLDEAQKTHVDLITEWQNELYDTVVKGMGIKPGSKMSAAVQQFGEKRITYEELVTKFGQQKADNIVKADEWFRVQYDTRLNQINKVLAEVYPDQPWKLIPKRQDYYHHFQVPTGLEQLKNVFFEAGENAGMVSNVPAYAKVKQRFLRFALRRKGGEFVDDAVGGYLNYTEAGAMAAAYNPMIAHTRRMAAELRKATQWAKVVKDGKVVRRMQNANAANNYATKVSGKVEPPTNNIDGFIEYLDEWTDNLAGKTHLFDRALNRISPKILDGATWINNRIKANVIAGNAGASIAQVFNMPMAVGRLNKYMIPGFSDAVAGPFVGESAAMRQSPFLRERFFRKNLQSKFEVGMLRYPKIFTSWMLRAGDEVASKIMWNAAYREAMAKGIENPIIYADDLVRSFVAGRAPGDVPLAFKSKVTQLVAPFQIEVNNLWLAIGDRVRNKEFGALVGFLLASWVFNRAAEQIRGTAVSFDPIEALIDGVRMSEKAKSVPEKIGVVGGRVAGEVLSSLPLGQSVGAVIPEEARRKYMGSRDPSRFGTGLPIVRGVESAVRTATSAMEGDLDPSLIYDIGMPFGGAQLRKTLEGATVINEGAVRGKGRQFNMKDALMRSLRGDEFFEGPQGKTRYRVARTPQNVARALLFGPYATPEAREYFEEQESKNISGGSGGSASPWRK